MRKQIITQNASGTWAASTQVNTAIERVGVITRLYMVNEVTPSATLGAANQPDGLFRPVGNLRIVGSPHTYLTLPAPVDAGQAGTLLHYIAKHQGLGLGHPDGVITAPSLTYTAVSYPFHCGVRPKDKYGRDNPFDLSAFVPASAESQLNVEWVTTANSVMDDTVTITSAVMRFTLCRILGSVAEIQAEMAAQELTLPPGVPAMRPAFSANGHVNVGATTDFSTETIDVPVGGFISQISILTQDAVATRPARANDELTRLQIWSVKTSEPLYEARLDYLNMGLEYGSNLEADDAAADFQAHCPKGIFLLDCRGMATAVADVGGRIMTFPHMRDYGWDFRGLNGGDIRLGLFNNLYAAGDDSLFLFHRYQEYRDRIIVNPAS